MKYLFIPQRNDNKLEYEFNNDVIKATLKEFEGEEVINETTETFDFSDMPNGEATDVIAETLPINPILKAKRVDGVLEVELLYYHGQDATDAEKFPDWVVV